MKQTIPQVMVELLAHTNSSFDPFNLEDDGYAHSDSSLIVTKTTFLLQIETKSSNTIITQVMMTGVANMEEWLASIKVMLLRMTKEIEKMHAQIKPQSERIANLTKKLEKQPS